MTKKTLLILLAVGGILEIGIMAYVWINFGFEMFAILFLYSLQRNISTRIRFYKNGLYE